MNSKCSEGHFSCRGLSAYEINNCRTLLKDLNPSFVETFLSHENFSLIMSIVRFYMNCMSSESIIILSVTRYQLKKRRPICTL